MSSLRRWVRQAGTVGEGNTARNGVLSHKSETHALAVGLGAGVATVLALATGAGTAGTLPAVAVVGYALGLRQLPSGADPHVVDVSREPAYALIGVAVSFVGGGLVAALLGVPVLEGLAGSLPELAGKVA